MFDLSEYIKICSIKRKIKIGEIAKMTGISFQNLCDKHKKNKFSNQDLEKIADALGAKLNIQFLDKDSGLPIA